MDFFEWKVSKFLCVVDYFSRFIEIASPSPSPSLALAWTISLLLQRIHWSPIHKPLANFQKHKVLLAPGQEGSRSPDIFLSFQVLQTSERRCSGTIVLHHIYNTFTIIHYNICISTVMIITDTHTCINMS